MGRHPKNGYIVNSLIIMLPDGSKVSYNIEKLKKKARSKKIPKELLALQKMVRSRTNQMQVIKADHYGISTTPIQPIPLIIPIQIPQGQESRPIFRIIPQMLPVLDLPVLNQFI